MANNQFKVRNGLFSQNVTFTDNIENSTNEITVEMIANDVLDINGDSGSIISFDDANRRVGIATTAPATALEVVGTITSDGLEVVGVVNFYDTTGTLADFTWTPSTSTLEVKNITVDGDLTVTGNTTTVSTTNLDITDAVLTLNKNQVTPLNDVGLLFQRYETADATNYNVGFSWDESADSLIIGKTAEDGSDNNLTYTDTWLTITDAGHLGVNGAAPGSSAFRVSGTSTFDGVVNVLTSTTQINHQFEVSEAIATYRSDAATWRLYQPTTNAAQITAVDGGAVSLSHDGTVMLATTADGVTINQDLTVTLDASVLATTTSTSSATGALTVAGGVGVAENVYAGGDIEVTGEVRALSRLEVGTSSATNLANFHNGTDANVILRVTGADESSEYIGLGVNGSDAVLTAGHATGATVTNLLIRTANASGVETNAITVAGSDQSVDVLSTTGSTSTSTGALTVAGGAGVAENLYVGGNLEVGTDITVTGNLTVNGDTITLNTSNLDVEDSIITLNKGQATAASDTGILLQRYSTATAANYNVGMFWDESVDKLIFGSTTEDGGGTTPKTVAFETEWLRLNNNGTAEVTGSINVGGNIQSLADTDSITILGGLGTGSNIELYGGTHPTQANNMFFDADLHTFRNADSTSGTVVDINGVVTPNSIAITDGGAEATPTLYWTGDTNTGIFHPAADTVSISTGGLSQLKVTSAAVVFGNQQRTYIAGNDDVLVLSPSNNYWVRVCQIKEGIHDIRIAARGNSSYHGARITAILNFESTPTGNNHDGVHISRFERDSGFSELTGEVFAEYVGSETANIWVKIEIGAVGSDQTYVFDVSGLTAASTTGFLNVSATTTDPVLTAIPLCDFMIAGLGTTQTGAIRKFSGRLNIGENLDNAPSVQGGLLKLANGGSQTVPAAYGGIEFVTATAGNGYGHRIVSFDNLNGDIPLVIQRRLDSAAWTNQVTFEGQNNNVDFAGGLSIGGDVSISSTTASTSSTTGALTVAGGLGMSGDIVFANVNNRGIYFGNEVTGTSYGYVRQIADGQLGLGSDDLVDFVETDTGTTMVSWSLNNGTYDFQGTISATTKSFDIEHPTKEGMRLRYGSLEGPENGVYVRGRLKGSRVIELPDYWTGLVHEDTITVNLTACGRYNEMWVDRIEDNKVYIESTYELDCFYTIFGERKDTERFDVEYEG